MKRNKNKKTDHQMIRFYIIKKMWIFRHAAFLNLVATVITTDCTEQGVPCSVDKHSFLIIDIFNYFNNRYIQCFRYDIILTYLLTYSMEQSPS